MTRSMSRWPDLNRRWTTRQPVRRSHRSAIRSPSSPNACLAADMDAMLRQSARCAGIEFTPTKSKYLIAGGEQLLSRKDHGARIIGDDPQIGRASCRERGWTDGGGGG